VLIEGNVDKAKPPNAVRNKDPAMSFLGENLSAIAPPYKYDKRATVP